TRAGGRELERIVPADAKQTLKAERLRDLWVDLAGDATRAQRAIRLLARVPDQAVPLIRERLRTPVGSEQDQIARLIADLDKDEFAVREKASRELAGLGERAEPALRSAMQNDPSPEARRRIQLLLPNLTGDAWPPSEVLRIIRVIEVLERIGTDETRRMLERLSKDASNSWTPVEAKAALERM